MADRSKVLIENLIRLAQRLLYGSLECPRCLAKIEAKGIDVPRYLATCQRCELVFDI